MGIPKWSTHKPDLTQDLMLRILTKALKSIPAISYWEMLLKIAHRSYITP